ncbi:thioredoxin family protein [Patescibacteria group bacterium]|nr:thioredoxin family protein [Patescibacteria group bacterium]
MNIKVLGSGCSSCKKLYELTKEAIEVLNLDSDLMYITDINEIIAMGVIETPALAINEKVILSGKLPSLEELKEIIKKEL